jgi:hypothetical protein
MPADQVANEEPLPLREDLTDIHYSQLFFVVGHVAIKMLSYVETMEKELKQALTDSFKSKKQKKKGDSSGEGSANEEEDDLA